MGGCAASGVSPAVSYARGGVGESVAVQTLKGNIKGFRPSAGGPLHFRGVPVAASTSGANRWKTPQPREPWTHVLDCTAYGDAPWQKPNTGNAGLMGKGRKTDSDIGKMGDDCLNINIVTPDLLGRAPVMVWIHGGANTIGSNKGDCGGWSPTHTDTWASRGVVVCSLSYRNSMHGFFHLPEEGVTNLALRDLLNGLQWVQDEIAAFGGDKGNVTIFGESSGGVNVAHLVSSPLAQTLYHRAIIQSGGPSGNISAKDYTEIRLPDFKHALLPLVQKYGHSVVSKRSLESLSGEDVHTAASKLYNSLEKVHGVAKCPDPYHIFIGDDVMPSHPTDQVRAGVAKGKQIILGCNAFEGQFLVNMLGSFATGMFVKHMVFATYLRGAMGFTKADEASMPRGCLSAARDMLTAKHQTRIDAMIGRSGQSFTMASPTDGLMQAFQQVWFTAPSTAGAWVTSLASHCDLYTYKLKLSEEECPSGNWHGLDLMLLFKPTDPEEVLWVSGAFGHLDGSRGEGIERVGAGMIDCWLSLAQSGQPGSFLGQEWAKFPKELEMATSPRIIDGPY